MDKQINCAKYDKLYILKCLDPANSSMMQTEFQKKKKKTNYVIKTSKFANSF